MVVEVVVSYHGSLTKLYLYIIKKTRREENYNYPILEIFDTCMDEPDTGGGWCKLESCERLLPPSR